MRSDKSSVLVDGMCNMLAGGVRSKRFDYIHEKEEILCYICSRASLNSSQGSIARSRYIDETITKIQQEKVVIY